MLKELEQGVKAVLTAHRENLEVWRGQEKELTKLTTAFSNHTNQRTLFNATDVSETILAAAYTDVKYQLLDKLDMKIMEYDAELRRKISLLEDQMQRISSLCTACTLHVRDIEFPELMNLKSTLLPTALLIEFVFDVEQVYSRARHQMLHFLNKDTIATFFQLSKFEDVLREYLLL